MSIHNLEAKIEGQEVLIGWDPPFQSFFVHVIDHRYSEDDPYRDVLWLGTTLREIQNLADLLPAIQPYVKEPRILSTRMFARLLADAQKDV